MTTPFDSTPFWIQNAPMAIRTLKASALLSVEEHAMLGKLAQDEGLSDAQILRRLIRAAYQRRYGSEKPTVTEATIRGLVTDIVAPAHLFVRNIGTRMNVATDVVMRVVKRLERKGLVEVLPGPGADHTAEWMGKSRALEEALALTEQKGFDIDEPIETDGD